MYVLWDNQISGSLPNYLYHLRPAILGHVGVLKYEFIDLWIVYTKAFERLIRLRKTQICLFLYVFKGMNSISRETSFYKG